MHNFLTINKQAREEAKKIFQSHQGEESKKKNLLNSL